MEPWLWTILLFALAVLLGILEAFVPSGGLLGSLSVLALIGSGVYAFLFHPVFGIFYVLVMVFFVPFFIWRLIRLWPKTRLGRRILLDPEQDPALVEDIERLKLKALVGKTGVATSRMMPSGTVEIDGRRYDALSDGMPIDPGQTVLVIRVDGINIMVRRTESQPPPTSVRRENVSLPEEPTVEDPFAD